MVVHILESYLKCLELPKQPWGGRRWRGKKRQHQVGLEVRTVGIFPPSFGSISPTAEATLAQDEGVSWLG